MARCRIRSSLLALGVLVLYVFFHLTAKNVFQPGLFLGKLQGRARITELHPENHTLLTLFTVFVDNPSTTSQQNNVIRNWPLLLPWLRPVLFITKENDAGLETFASFYGWKVIPVQSTNQFGSPILAKMFQTITKEYNSTFYGYATEDLLFSYSLIDTLEIIQNSLNLFNNTLIVGKRTNLSNEKPNKSYTILGSKKLNRDLASMPSLWRLDDVTRMGAERPQFRVDVANYFITTKEGYPWRTMKPVVLGRSGLTNYLLSVGLHHLTVLDTSATLLALHEPSPINSKSRKLADSYYNKRLIGNSMAKQDGVVTKALFETKIDIGGNIFIKVKDKIPPKPKRTIKNKQRAKAGKDP